EFEDSDENKLIYTDLFGRYTGMIESHIDEKLRSRMPDFNMESLFKMMVEREDEITGDVFEMLLSFGEFSEFKKMMLAHRVGYDQGLTDLGMG
ncbi:unnamed protein product, partial [Discosporangium mesarthrocarpum]